MATATNPFAEFDVTKVMADLRVPGVDVDHLMKTSKKNIDAVNAANSLLVEGMKEIAKRQAEIVREAMEDAASASSEMMTQGSPEDKVAKQTELAKSAFEKALSNVKELAEMTAKSQSEAFDVINKRLSETMDEFKASLAKK